MGDLERRIQMVGSWPAASTEEALPQMLALGAHPFRWLPDGEPGERSGWILKTLREYDKHPDFEITREGTYDKGFDDMPVHRITRGHTLDPDDLKITIYEDAKASWPIFDSLRREHGRHDLRMQVGVPGYLQIPFATFQSPAYTLRHMGPFAEALRRNVHKVYDDPEVGGSSNSCQGIIFQLELPGEVAAMHKVAKAPPRAQRAVAEMLGYGIKRQVAAMPIGAQIGLHLCRGDLNNEAYASFKDLGPMVRLVQSVLRQWPDERHPPAYVHLPLAGGKEIAPTDPEFYRPLGKLALSTTRIAAGLVHENATMDELKAALKAAEDSLGRPVDIAASCGLGRRTPEVAQSILLRSVLLTSK